MTVPRFLTGSDHQKKSTMVNFFCGSRERFSYSANSTCLILENFSSHIKMKHLNTLFVLWKKSFVGFIFLHLDRLGVWRRTEKHNGPANFFDEENPCSWDALEQRSWNRKAFTQLDPKPKGIALCVYFCCLSVSHSCAYWVEWACMQSQC